MTTLTLRVCAGSNPLSDPAQLTPVSTTDARVSLFTLLPCREGAPPPGILTDIRVERGITFRHVPGENTGADEAATTDFGGVGLADLDGDRIIDMQQPDGMLVDQYESLIGDGLDESRVTKGWGVMFADLDNDADVDVHNTSSCHDYSFDTELSGTLTGQLIVLRHDITGDTHSLVDIPRTPATQ